MNSSSSFSVTIYLRLGYIYLYRKAWGDAKGIFARSIEVKPNSSLAWLGLGISNLRLGELHEVSDIAEWNSYACLICYFKAEEALSQANIYDPFSGDTWGYLSLLCLVRRTPLCLD